MAELVPESIGKTGYFARLAARNLSSAKQLRTGGVLGKGPDIWRNVSEHTLVQTAACDILAEELGLAQDSRKNLGLAAMAHDWDKKFQTIGLKKINGQVESGEVSEEEGGKLKFDFFEESEEHSVEGMRKNGIPEQIIKIASADGHPALPRMTDPSVTIEEKVLHYVGSIVDENDIGPLDVRIDKLESNARYSMMNDYGRQVLWTGGRTLYEVQREVGHQIESEIVDLLLASGRLDNKWRDALQKDPKMLPAFIKAKIEEEYTKPK